MIVFTVVDMMVWIYDGLLLSHDQILFYLWLIYVFNMQH